MTPDSQPSKPSVSYKRDLGLAETFSIVIGRIIGSGIFRTPAPIMLLTGAVGLFYGVWIIGGIATILGALLYAELVAMMPKSGGPYQYLKEAYHPIVTFLRGWAMFFVSETASIAAVALVFVEYGSGLLELFGYPVAGLPGKGAIAVLLIWLLTALNLYGVRLSGVIQDVLSFFKIIALGAIIGVGFAASPNPDHFSGSWFPEGFGWEQIVAIGAALRYAFFAYSGWEGATYVAEEVKRPERNLPLSLFLGIGGVMFLYLATNTAYLAQLSPVTLAQSPSVALEAMSKASGMIGGVLVTIAVMANTFGNVSSQILVKSRTWHAMARDGLFFEWLSKLDDKTATPNRALIVQAVWASVLTFMAVSSEILKPESQKQSLYETIIDFFSFTSTVFNILTFASVYVLRVKKPEWNRPFKTPFFPVVFGLVMLIQVSFLLFTLITAFWPSVAGIVLTGTGLIYWQLVVRKREIR